MIITKFPLHCTVEQQIPQHISERLGLRPASKSNWCLKKNKTDLPTPNLPAACQK